MLSADVSHLNPLHSMIDLHGLSVAQAKSTVLYWLVSFSQTRCNRIRFVTGRGNHQNARGERGTLFKFFPDWINEAKLDERIARMEEHDGFYEVYFKSNAISDPSEKAFLEITERLLQRDHLDIKMRAEQGDPYFQVLYGSMLEAGKHFDQNFTEAFRYFRLAAKQKYPMGIMGVVRCYFHGVGTRQSDEKAFRYLYLHEADCHDYAPFVYTLGDFYWLGTGTDQNYEKAVACFIQAANLGHSAAMRKLAFSYKEGIGIKQDKALSLQWYQRAADAGDSTAQFNTAIYFSEGLDIEINLKKAWHYFCLSAKNGDPEAQYRVGLWYWHGTHVKADREKAMVWFKRAADNHSIEANHLLSQIAAPELRQSYLERAARAGDIASDLKIKLQRAEETKDDSPETIHKIIDASLAQHASRLDTNQITRLDLSTRMLLLDEMIAHKKKNIREKALTVLESMADGKCVFSLRRLAVIYQNGISVTIDMEKSLEYLRKAIVLHDSKSMVLLGYFHDRGLHGLAKSIATAMDWYEKAAKLNNPTALYNLGRIHESGGSGKTDWGSAYHYYRQAILAETDKNLIENLHTGRLDDYEFITKKADYCARRLLFRLGRVIKSDEPLPVTPHAETQKTSPPATNLFKSPVAIRLKDEGNQAFKKGDFTKAITLYDLALQHSKTLKEIWFNRGLCQLKINQPQIALQNWAEAIALDPLYIKAVYQQVCLLFSLGEKNLGIEAIRHYQMHGGSDVSILRLQQADIAAAIGKDTEESREYAHQSMP